MFLKIKKHTQNLKKTLKHVIVKKFKKYVLNNYAKKSYSYGIRDRKVK